jgi:polyhydroxybutyrate depolymerase
VSAAPRVGIAVGVGAALLLAGCSSSSGSSKTASASTRAATTACRGGGSEATTTLTVDSGGRGRTVIVHTPTGSTNRTRSALVLNLHGSGSTAAGQEAFSGMDAAADSDGFIVAYPQGAIAQGVGDDWNVPDEPLIGGAAAPADAPDDVAFLTKVITTLEQRNCIDTRRVYVTGFSGGARMASQLGCDLSTRVAAIAPVSGLRFPDPCPSTRPMPLIAFHGTADPIDPYNGNGQPYWTDSVPDAAARWGAHDGCASTPGSTTPEATVTVTTYSGCAASAGVELYSIAGAGHTWPGGPPVPKALRALLGPRSTAVDANALMWAFFRRHELP